MKIIAALSMLLLICAAFVFTGCNDQSTGLLTGSQPNLAASDDLVKVTSKTGDGPEVVRYVKPERWDGVSEVKDGVVYRFSCEEELLAAFSSIPGFLEQYQEAKGGKVKAADQASLASADGGASVTDWGEDIECCAWGENSSGYSSVSYTLIVDVGTGSAGYYNTFTDYQAHSESIGREGPCPAYGAIAHAWVSGAGNYVSEHDSGSCD